MRLPSLNFFSHEETATRKCMHDAQIDHQQNREKVGLELDLCPANQELLDQIDASFHFDIRRPPFKTELILHTTS